MKSTLPTSIACPREGAGTPPGQAEVDDLDPVIGGQKDVARLEIAMDQLAAVRRLQAGRGLPPPLAAAWYRLRAVHINEMLQVPARYEFENQVVHGLGRSGRGEDPRVVGGHDVRMIERCQRMAFSVEAIHQLRRDGLIHRQDLDGHATAERLMFTEEYHRRATPAQPIEDAITPEHQAEAWPPITRSRW